MAFPTPAADYKGFRLNKINEEQYRHLWLLLFWPVYIGRYLLLELLNPVADCTVVWCPLDDKIPFLEGFVVFYVLWYVFIFGMHLWLMLYDIPGFKRYTKFLMIAMTISTVTYLLFPTCQELRPETFPRDNLASRVVGILYAVDNSTNVCPSEHVIGALAVLAAALDTKTIRPAGKILTAILAVLISLSTVFIKQHSALDILAAIPVCALAWLLCYRRKKYKER